jgi:hypothetical protein
LSKAKSAPSRATDGYTVSIKEIAEYLKVTDEHVRSWVGEEFILTHWSGLPATDVVRAREVVEWFRNDVAERDAREKADRVAREERERWVRARYNELLAQAPQDEALKAKDDWGGGHFTPTAGLVTPAIVNREKLMEQAEREADRRGL